MTVRPFDWRDLGYLHHIRSQSVYLDSALLLTRGSHLVPGALFSYLAPGLGIFTAVSDSSERSSNDRSTVIGQIIHLQGSPFAHLTYITPEGSLESPELAAVLEYLIAIAGERGAFRLLADIDDDSATYEVMRKAGFATYSRQRIWQLTRQLPVQSTSNTWRVATRKDILATRLLYNNLVPGLVQQIEPFSTEQRPHGMVFGQGDDLLAYVEIRYGHRGIWMQPFVHPDTQNITNHITDLLQRITNQGSRPLYICVRSYQSWLETALEELGAELAGRQAVMVKHLGNMLKAARLQSVPALEAGQPEITTPIARSSSK